jgi:hypothetical protein
MFYKFLLCAASASLLSLAATPFQNPSFENDIVEYSITRMKTPLEAIKNDVEDTSYQSFIDTQQARTGTRSLFAATDNPVGRNYIRFDNLPCTGNKEFEFTAWYRLAEVKPGCTLWYELWFYDANNEFLRHRNGSHFEVTADRWLLFSSSFFAPKNAARCAVNLKFCGPMKVWVDDVAYRELPEPEFPQTDGSILQDNSAFVLYSDRPMFQIPETGLPEGLKKEGKITLTCAGNEAESFQIVVHAKQDITAISAAIDNFSDGKNQIPATQVDIRRVEFANVVDQPNPRMPGRHADPLVEFNTPAAVTAGKNLGLFLTVKVPANTPKGVYNSTITLSSAGQKLATVPIELQVWGFSLPARPQLRTYFYTEPGFGGKAYLKYDPRPANVVLDEAHKLLAEMRVSGNQAHKAAAPKWKKIDGKVVVTDWTPFDKSMEKLLNDYNFSNFGIPILRTIGDNSGWFKSPGRKTHKRWSRTVGSEPPATPFGGYYDEPEGIGWVIDYAKAFTAYVKEKYPDINFYYYLYDEVPFDVYEALAPIVKQLTEAVPDLKIMLVASYYGDMLPPYHTKVASMNGQSVRSPGNNYQECWFYQFQSSLDPACFLSARSYPWKIYTANGTGGLLWSTLHCGSGENTFDPWTELGTKYENPVATLFYPPYQGNGGVVPSLRAWQMRDGIEDFDYLKLLEQKKGREYVLNCIAPFIKDPLENPNDFQTLDAIRAKIAAELE